MHIIKENLKTLIDAKKNQIQETELLMNSKEKAMYVHGLSGELSGLNQALKMIQNLERIQNGK